MVRRLVSSQNDIENISLNLGQTRLEYGYRRSGTSSISGRGKFSPHFVYIGLTVKGNEFTRCNGMPVGERNLRIFPEGTDIFYQSQGECEWFLCSIPRYLLQAALSAHPDGLTLPTNQIITIKLSNTTFEHLTGFFKEMFSFIEPLAKPMLPPDVINKLSSDLINECATAISKNDNQWLGILPNRLSQLHGQLILASETLVLSSENYNIKLSELADSTGYTLRALEMIFKNTVGMSPKGWFINMRLNGALRDLMTAQDNDNVAKTATRWGFQHLARFSSTYRSTFSERPSETLARSRKRKIP
ncbi:helix-turn-helix transcriptional regulator [Leminorella grimontii]|nr:helix-turn-helix transcriptional regulator [Leminorella grimontii]